MAIGGSVGNIPRVDNVDIQYAQSAMFSPFDIYLPHDATLIEASANTEGKVTNLRHRRLDLYGGLTKNQAKKYRAQ